MKITSKEITSTTLYRAIEGEHKKKRIVGTLITTFYDDLINEYHEFEFLQDDSEIKLTKKEIERFKHLAIISQLT